MPNERYEAYKKTTTEPRTYLYMEFIGIIKNQYAYDFSDKVRADVLPGYFHILDDDHFSAYIIEKTKKATKQPNRGNAFLSRSLDWLL